MVEVFDGAGTPDIEENYQLAEPPPPGVQFPAPLKSLSDITNSVWQDPQLPYAFCGQIQSDVGFGSGIAVQEGVVLTAAHLVFDDRSLTWVHDLNWFFQKQDGESDPKPIRPRGAQMLSGYASARRAAMQSGDYLPGQSSPGSRLWDVAALYFWEPAARSGSSGYLASDAQPNEWLVSSKLKVLVGYPTDASGYIGIVPGKMHATEPRNDLFSPESSQVYLSSDFLSFPGNSGGPLCVLYDHNRTGTPKATYYPAGIYLGSVGVKSAVRAIDRDVVNLIRIAVNSADFGKNFTGGGVLAFAVPNLPGLKVGYLKIEMDPPCALNAGAKWWVEGYSNLFSTTEAVAGFEQRYVIRFGGIPGYLAPGEATVDLSDRHTNTVRAVYRPIQPASLQVTLSPAGRVQTEGRWSLSGELDRWASGATRSLTPCDYQVVFAPVDGYATPEPRWVSLGYGQTNLMEVSYRPLLALGVSGQGRLRVVGVKGSTYQIQMKSDLSVASVWSNAWTVTLTSDSDILDYRFPTNQRSLFYRAVLK